MVSRLIVFLAAGLLSARAEAADPLPPLSLEADGLTVSGLSSGAYMAVQFHVAHSEEVDGAAVIAGGPYFCARGSVFRALWSCMETWWGAPDAGRLLSVAQGFADDDLIDPIDGLADDRVYLFHGTEDRTVRLPPMDAAQAFYLAAGIDPAAVLYVTDVPAGHGFLADGAPIACGATGTPFLNDCDIEQAGELLAHLYPGLAAPGATDPSRLRSFDQSEFLPDPTAHGMAEEGFVYVPEVCETGPCRLHIALAGCRQTPEMIGDLYARTTGFNRWAETNRLVILYPQTHVVPSPWYWPWGGNPKGCWDWWGYDDADYATRQGSQLAAIAAMAGRLGVTLD